MIDLGSRRLKNIIKKVALGIVYGLINYAVYFIIPDYVYRFISYAVASTYPEIASIIEMPHPYPSIEIVPLILFIVLSCLSSLLSGSWLGYIVGVSSSAVFMFYAISLMNFGKISADYQGISITVDFSMLIVIWFCSYILDILGRAFDLIESSASFFPTL